MYSTTAFTGTTTPTARHIDRSGTAAATALRICTFHQQQIINTHSRYVRRCRSRNSGHRQATACYAAAAPGHDRRLTAAAPICATSASSNSITVFIKASYGIS